MASKFLLQIVEAKTGEVVAAWEPGLRIEKGLINDLSTRVAAKGVGVGRTTAHVVADIEDAFEDLLYELKRDVSPR